MAFCTACGQRLTPAARFCTRCGGRVTDESPVSRPDPATGPAGEPGAVAPSAPVSPGSDSAGPAAGTHHHERTGARAVTPDTPQGTGPVPHGDSPGGTPGATPGPASGSAAPATPFLGAAGASPGAFGSLFAPSAMTRAQVTTAARNGAVVVAASIAVLFVVALVIGVTAGREHPGAPVDWFRVAIMLFGWGVHAPVVVEFPGGTVSVAAMPFLVTALVAGASWWLSRRTRASTVGAPGTTVPFALLTGATGGLLAAVLAASAAGPVAMGDLGELGDLGDLGTTVRGGAAPVWTFALTTLVLAAATLVGVDGADWRARVAAPHLDGRLAPWRTHLRLGRDVVLATLAAGALGLLVYVLRQALGGHHGGTVHVAGTTAHTNDLWSVLLLLPNLVVAAAGFGMGGTLAAHGSAARLSAHDVSASIPYDPSTGLLSGHYAAADLMPFLLLTAVAVLVAGLRGALHRAPDAGLATRWWQPAAVTAAAWFVLALAVRVIGSGEGGIPATGRYTGSGWAGLGLPSTVLMAAVWGLVAAAAGTWLARALAGVRPGLTARFAGRSLDPQWRLLLADAALRRGEEPGSTLAPVADDLRAGRLAPPPRPLTVDARRDRLVALGVLGLLAVALVATVVHAVVQSTLYTREKAVTAYLDAVRDHDAAGALSMVAPAERPEGAAPLLTNAAMGTLPPYAVESVDDDAGAVQVRFDVDGTPVRRTFHVSHDETGSGLFDHYTLVDPFSRVSARAGNSVAPGSVKTAGVVVPDSAAVAFPGVYLLTADPTSPGVEVAQVRQVALDTEPPSVELDGKIGSGAQQAAAAAVKKYVDGCAAQTVAQPQNCPFSQYGTFTAVTWRVDSYPHVEVTPSGDHLSVSSTDEGQVTFSGAQSSIFGGTPSPTTEPVTYRVSGRLQWDGKNPDSAQLQPTSY